MAYQKKSCPICNFQSYYIIYQKILDKDDNSYSPAISEKEKGAIVKCKRCKTIYKLNFPSNKKLKEGYEESVDDQYLSLLNDRRRTFSELLDVIERYSRRGKILDIGCAEGTLIDIAKKRGWDVTGIEPNKNFIKWAKKNYDIEIIQGSIPNKRLRKGSFDVITLLDVVEHVPDPEKFLRECSHLLKKGGNMFISTPDFSSIHSRLMGRKWFYILNIHLFYFTRDTLKPLLEKAGLRLMAKKHYYLLSSLDYFFRKSRNYLGLFGDFIHKIVKISGLDNKFVKYWLGQSLFVCRKTD